MVHDNGDERVGVISTGTGTPAQKTSKVDENTINDQCFIHNLTRLKELRSFFIQEAINVNTDGSANLAFGKLNLLKYDLNGRSPTELEWSEVEFHTQTLFGVLTGPLRRRFMLGQIPSWVTWLPIALALLAFGALVGAIIMPLRFVKSSAISLGAATLPFYLVWLMSLGAIGSVAFIGMNALSVQQDVTFDLSNRRLMQLRIVLGAMFALVLTLPFGFSAFMEFIGTITGVKPSELAPNAQKISGGTQAVLLLLPFVLGFSTSLVIMILNRLVDAVQGFFGRAGTIEHREDASGTPAVQPAKAAASGSAFPPIR